MFAVLTACIKMQTGCVKTGDKWNLNVFRRFNGKPLMYVFPWKVTNVFKIVKIRVKFVNLEYYTFDNVFSLLESCFFFSSSLVSKISCKYGNKHHALDYFMCVACACVCLSC